MKTVTLTLTFPANADIPEAIEAMTGMGAEHYDLEDWKEGLTIVQHDHKYGTDVHVYAGELTEEQAATSIGDEYEPERDETLELTQLTAAKFISA